MGYRDIQCVGWLQQAAERVSVNHSRACYEPSADVMRDLQFFEKQSGRIGIEGSSANASGVPDGAG